jgi:hypothetical protein
MLSIRWSFRAKFQKSYHSQLWRAGYRVSFIFRLNQYGEIIKNENKRHFTQLRRSSERLWCVAILQFHITAILDARSCRKTQRNWNYLSIEFGFRYYVPLAKWLSCVPISSSAFHITASFDERDVLWPSSENPVNHRAEVLCNSCWLCHCFSKGVVCISLSEWLRCASCCTRITASFDERYARLVASGKCWF